MGRKQVIFFFLLLLSACGMGESRLARLKGFDVNALLEKDILHYKENKDIYLVMQKLRVADGLERENVTAKVVVSILEEIKAMDLNRVTGNRSYLIDTTYTFTKDSSIKATLTYTLRPGENSPVKLLILESLTGDSAAFQSLQFLRREDNILFSAEQKCFLFFRDGHVRNIIFEAREGSLFTKPLPFFTQINIRERATYGA